VEQQGDVFEMVPKATQKEAVSFLHKQLFETPTWMLDKNIVNKFSAPTSDPVSSLQDQTLGSLLSTTRLSRMATMMARYNDAYGIDEYYNDLKKGIFRELPGKAKIDPYRRNLQKGYVDRMIGVISPSGGSSTVSLGGLTLSTGGGEVKRNDVSSVTRAHLVQLRSEINSALPGYTDNLSKYHLQDLSDRIRQALDPK